MSRIDYRIKRNIKVRVQLCRSSGGTHEGSFRLSIEDETSGLLILEATMNSDAIADMISSRISGIVSAEYYHNDRIGKRMVNKDTIVDLNLIEPFPFESYDEKEKERDLKKVYAFAEKLNPGWEADRDKFNSKKYVKNAYRVTLRKYES